MGKLTIAIDSSKVGSVLTDFPVLVVLNSTFVDSTTLAAINSNPLKVSFKDSTETTEYYVELESTTTTETRYWIKISSISSSADTIIIFEYDLTTDNTSYVDVTGNTASQNVWSSEFLNVYHFAQDPSGGSGCILDSTSNGNGGTPNGSMTSDDLVTTNYGFALDLDGVNDYISFPFDKTSAGSLPCIITQFIPSETTFNNYSFGNTALSGSPWIISKQASYYVNGSYTLSHSDIVLNEMSVHGLSFESSLWKHWAEGISSVNAATAIGSNAASYFFAGVGYSDYFTGKFIQAFILSKSVDADWMSSFYSSIIGELISFIGTPLSLSGTVKDESDNILSGADVYALDPTTKEIMYSTQSTTSGTFSINYVLDQAYDIVAELDTYQSNIINGVSPVEV